MDDTSKIFETSRQNRLKRLLAAEFLAMAPASKVDTESASLSWSVLLDIPDWCHWPVPRIEQLVLVSGGLFAAPGMRLWIETKRITAAKQVIGKELFEKIITHKSVPHHKVLQFPDDVDLMTSLQAVGANVLLNSLPHQCLRTRLAFLVPKPLGVLSHDIALSLSRTALTLVKDLKTKGAS